MGLNRPVCSVLLENDGALLPFLAGPGSSFRLADQYELESQAGRIGVGMGRGHPWPGRFATSGSKLPEPPLPVTQSVAHPNAVFLAQRFARMPFTKS